MHKSILLALVTASLATTIAVMYLVITSPRRSLDRFLAQVATVEIGKTRFEDWRTQVERAQHSKVNVVCDLRKCGIGWNGENRLLSKLHLAPRTAADVSVGFEDGIASDIFIILSVAKHDEKGNWWDDKTAVVHQHVTGNPLACSQDYGINVQNRYGVGERNRAIVAMGSCVSPENRSKALAINTSCLTRIGGCKTVESMLPQVFAHPETSPSQPADK